MRRAGRLGIVFAAAVALLATAAPAWAASIGGTVTDASNGEGLEGVLVCAYEPLASQAEAEAGRKCADSEANGEYLIGGGVGAGSYKVGFQPQVGSKYASQFYDGVDSWGEAELVEVLSGPVLGIDAALEEANPDEDPPDEGPPEEGGASEAALPPLAAAPPAALPVEPQPKPLRCRKGFKKKRVKGKVRCVKARPVRHPRPR